MFLENNKKIIQDGRMDGFQKHCDIFKMCQNYEKYI